MSAIDDKYSSPGIQAILGKPTSDELICPDHVGHFRHFQYGSIYWHPNTGTYEVHGAIRVKWAGLGWERSFLGYPTSDEAGTPDGQARYSRFQGGDIYSSPVGTYEVHGAIDSKWASLGREQSILGYPKTNETVTPDGHGRFNHFQNGSIYWTSQTGAHYIASPIIDYWSRLGWEKSYLGYPITDTLAPVFSEIDWEDQNEYDILNKIKLPIYGQTRVQRFQNGSIFWSPVNGAIDIPKAHGGYMFVLDRFQIYKTRAIHLDTDHIKLSVAVDNEVVCDLPVMHVGDVNDGDHPVSLYTTPIQFQNLDSMITFSYTISNIGDGTSYADIEKGLSAVAKAGLVAAGIPGADAIVELATKVFDFFNQNCDGPVAVHQKSMSGHVIDVLTANSIYSIIRPSWHLASQGNCNGPKYLVFWSLIKV